MPTLRPKPSYKGKCLEDLKKYYNIEIPKKETLALCKSAQKLLLEAAKKDKSEEDRYILYMRYLNVVSYVQKSDDFREKKREIDAYISKKSVLEALESAEKLSEKLKQRYDELSKAEEARTPEPMKDAKIPKGNSNQVLITHLQTPSSTDTESIAEASEVENCISSMELFKILQKDPSNVLIMDARPRNQFSESHIKLECNVNLINIPEEDLQPGCSAAKLAEKLPPESKVKWKKRLEVDYLVLMDYSSEISNLSLPLQCLQTIILKWDPCEKYRSKPLILNGGFSEWNSHYPMHCTNAKPQVPTQDPDDLPPFDNVSYPELTDETPKFSRATKPSPGGSAVKLNNVVIEFKDVTPNQNIDIKEPDLIEDTPLPAAKDEQNVVLRKEPEPKKDIPNEKPPKIVIPAPYAGDMIAVSQVPPSNTKVEPSTLIGDKSTNNSLTSTGSVMKRCRSSPNIAQLGQEPTTEVRPSQPHVDRNNKPILQKPLSIDFINRPRNFHEVYGNVRPGLTGLKNLGNSCYMNSILQCISSLNLLSNYFCSGKYKDDINQSKSNPTRGEVAEEVAHVVRNLWLGQYRSIACRDLKNVVGKHMDQFRGCGQQDAHEFLTFLMDWLHNDLMVQKEEIIPQVSKALSSTAKKADEDAQIGAMKAWNEFKNNHESIMLSVFFVQQVSTVQCHNCSEKSMNFEEPTSNLTLLLPNAPKCSLLDCLQLYTSKEKISGYKCEMCKRSNDAVKSVDLYRLPPILIIHLKRFYADGFYQKRQTYVDFPLKNLDMKGYTLNPNQHYTVYDLCAVSNHYGTLEGGHYTAYCKNGQKWYKFDDQDVSEISSNNVKSADAYILFYAAVK